jgi:hypothetical protein
VKVCSWLGAFCLSAGLLLPCSASAQGKGGAASSKAAAPAKPAAGSKGAPKADTPKDKAAPYVKEGAKLAASGEWDDAYAEYAIAWSIDPTWETAIGLGKAAHHTKRFAEAIARLTFGLSGAPDGKIAAKERAEIDGILKEARASTGLLFITAPAGSDVLVDGDQVGKTPLADGIPVDPGKHKVEVRSGATGETKSTDVAAGAKVTLDFTPAKPPPPKTVVVKEEGVFTPQVRTAAVIGGGALALAGIVAGGVSLGFSFTKADELSKAQIDPYGQAAAKSAAQVKSDAQNVALWCFVGGGAAAVATGVFYLVTRPRVKAPPPPVQGSFFVTPEGGGLSVGGRF